MDQKETNNSKHKPGQVFHPGSETPQTAESNQSKIEQPVQDFEDTPQPAADKSSTIDGYRQLKQGDQLVKLLLATILVLLVGYAYSDDCSLAY